MHVSSWCWRHSKSKGTDRLVLISIADMADDDGDNAFPSYPTIAERCGGISIKTVQRSAQRLAELGELAIQVHGGPAREGITNQRSNRYSFPAYKAHEKWSQSVLSSGGPGVEDRTSEAEDRTSEARRPDTAMSAYPSLDPSLDPSSSSASERFDLEEPPRGPARKIKKVSQETEAPERFEVSLGLRGWFRDSKLAKLGVDPLRETEQWLDYHRAKGSRFKDWDASWRTWMRNQGKFATQASNAGARRGDNRVDRAALPANDWRRFSEQ